MYLAFDIRRMAFFWSVSRRVLAFDLQFPQAVMQYDKCDDINEWEIILSDSDGTCLSTLQIMFLRYLVWE